MLFKRIIFLLFLFFFLNASIAFSLDKNEIKAKENYFEALNCYIKLSKSPYKKYRERWLFCIDKFEKIYEENTIWSAAAYYQIGNIYSSLYKYSAKQDDIRQAYHIFSTLIKDYPHSVYSKSAEKYLEKIRKYKIDFYSRKKENKKIDFALSQNKLLKLRYWSNKQDYVRIVIDSNTKLSYFHKYIKKDKEDFVYLDFVDASLDKDFIFPKIFSDKIIKDITLERKGEKRYRLAIKLDNFKSYKSFSLESPYRVVVDIWGDIFKESYEKIPVKKRKFVKEEKNADFQYPLKILNKKTKTIIIDPGHGGFDPGAPGICKIFEKDIVLSISKIVAKKIETNFGWRVIMTRNKDVYLDLEERTAIANANDGDIFISIHANASGYKHAYGIETYFLNLALDEEASQVAMQENKSKLSNISDLEIILTGLIQNSKMDESKDLAASIQDEMCQKITKNFTKINNKGVKQAPFFVLIGARMPAVLIETGFISNMEECKKLKSRKYQETVSDAIVNGIYQYFKRDLTQ